MVSIKYILTLLIIIFSLSMSAQNYIKVLPQAGLTSEQRAEAISYELWAISRPPQVRNPNDVTTYLFGWVKHPTQDSAYTDIVNTSLEIDLNYNIIVHPENNLTNLSDNYIIMYDASTQKYTPVNPDDILLKAVTEASSPGIPTAFVDQLEVDLENKINLDAGTF